MALCSPHKGRDKFPESWWTLAMCFNTLDQNWHRCHFHFYLVTISPTGKAEVTSVEKYTPPTGKRKQGDRGREGLW